MKYCSTFLLNVILFMAIIFAPLFNAKAAEPNTGEIDLKVTTEENKQMIIATVTTEGKPLANATVNFFVERTFGNLGIGHDVTLDDGTAAVPFPIDLPGGTAGKLQVIAEISNPPEFNSVRSESIFDGGRIIWAQSNVFPRALWAPQAPLVLIVTIGVLLMAVWGIYFYIAGELIKIFREGKK